MNLTDLTVSRTIPAPAEKVFDVWIDPKSPGGPWFGADRVILNPVVDGLFYLAVKHEGRTWPHYGRFLQIERPRVVEYTWMSDEPRAPSPASASRWKHEETRPRSHSATRGCRTRKPSPQGAPLQASSAA